MENHPVFIMIADRMSDWDNTLGRELKIGWELLCDKSHSRTIFSKRDLEDASEDSYAFKSPVSSWLLSRLFSACRKGHADAIQAFMPVPDVGVIPLCIVVAAMHGQLSLLEMLLSHCDVTIPSIKIEHSGLFLNALEHATLIRRSDIVQLLLHAGQSIELFGDITVFYSLLDDAVSSEQTERVHTLFLLLETQVISSNSKLGILDEALSRASSQGHDGIVKAILRYGVNPGKPDTSGMSPLFLAINNSHFTTIRLLLEHGASTSFSTKHGSPLTFAASLGDTRIVELLLKYHEDNSHYGEGRYVFALADQGPTEHGPTICLCPNPLYVASGCGHMEVVKLLIRHGISKSTLR